MPDKLESIFIEIVCPMLSNIIVGWIYNPSLQRNNFRNDITLSLLEKLNKENSNNFFFLGDFNIDLLKYQTSEPANNSIETFIQFSIASHTATNWIFQFLFNFN